MGHQLGNITLHAHKHGFLVHIRLIFLIPLPEEPFRRLGMPDQRMAPHPHAVGLTPLQRGVDGGKGQNRAAVPLLHAFLRTLLVQYVSALHQVGHGAAIEMPLCHRHILRHVQRLILQGAAVDAHAQSEIIAAEIFQRRFRQSGGQIIGTVAELGQHLLPVEIFFRQFLFRIGLSGSIFSSGAFPGRPLLVFGIPGGGLVLRFRTLLPG